MRALIRSRRTKAFLKPNGRWTRHIQEAMHLPGIVAIIEVTKRLHLVQVEMYYSFAKDYETQWDFTLSLV
jgi:hypothetical protein